MMSLVAMLAMLLFLSGLFSSAETALFSLDRNERTQVGPHVADLLARPGELLVSILLGNLVFNVLFFTIVGHLAPDLEGIDKLLLGLGALLAVLIFGEILPKTFGLRMRVGVARWTARPLGVWRLLLRPISGFLTALLESSHRVISTWADDERALTPEMFANLMDRSARDGSFVNAEAEILAEIVELGDIRVREIMTPRVDALFLDVSGGNRDEVLASALKGKQSWLPVVEGNPDQLLGQVRVRDLYRSPATPIGELVTPIKVVPEVASALGLLKTLQGAQTSEAAVVDEWGGTAGYVTAEDVFEELVGDLRTEDETRTPAVVPLGEGRYRVKGNLSIRDWNQEFGLAIVPREFETVGGFITTLLGRIPREGDRAQVDRMVLQVHSVRGRRVEFVDLFVSPAAVETEGSAE